MNLQHMYVLLAAAIVCSSPLFATRGHEKSSAHHHGAEHQHMHDEQVVASKKHHDASHEDKEDGHAHAPAAEKKNIGTVEVIVLTMRGCGPCDSLKKQLPRFTALAEGIVEAENIRHHEHTTAEAAAHVKKFKGLRPMGFPTILLIVDGKGIAHTSGGRSAKELWNWVQESLQKAGYEL